MKFKFFLFLIIFSMGLQAKIVNIDVYNRLDPHGPKHKPSILPSGKECSVCHLFKEGKTITRKNTEKNCILCHNKSPHSGVQEHLEKVTQDKKAMTCLTCHTAHRWEEKQWESPGNFWSPKKNEPVKPPEDSEEHWTDQHNKNSLIIKSCSECHKW